MKRVASVLVSLAVLSGTLCAQRGAVSGRSPEQAAFAAARAVEDPGQRVSALLEFLRAFPGSSMAGKANQLALETDLAAFPERTDEIHTLASREVNGVAAGLDRWLEESRVADALANAGATGADLEDAKAWAQQALGALTEESLRREAVEAQARFKLPPLPAKQVHQDYVGYRAAFLAALANVELRLKQPDAAEPLLREAFRLQPLSSKVNRLQGELALDRHEDAAALEDFERAAATGALNEPWRGEMVRLYGMQNADGEAGLTRKIDALYATLYPPVFALTPRTLPAGGHTVLLELFTGAGCDPCVAPDLAVDSLLKTYGRHDLVVLVYDENIPRPDPLSNPSSEARAVAYGIGTTPEAFLDGESLPVAGASRADAENVVVGFADAIEERAAEATGAELALKVTRGSGGKITADARATVRPLRDSAGAQTVRAEMHFALVQDHIRYAGENGVRFHRMVVRAVERGADTEAGAQLARQAEFDLPVIAAQLRGFLDGYERRNDRFGEVRFREKDFPLEPHELAVVAWVENAVTHEVLQTAYAPVPVN